MSFTFLPEVQNGRTWVIRFAARNLAQVGPGMPASLGELFVDKLTTVVEACSVGVAAELVCRIAKWPQLGRRPWHRRTG